MSLWQDAFHILCRCLKTQVLYVVIRVPLLGWGKLFLGIFQSLCINKSYKSNKNIKLLGNFHGTTRKKSDFLIRFVLQIISESSSILPSQTEQVGSIITTHQNVSCSTHAIITSHLWCSFWLVMICVCCLRVEHVQNMFPTWWNTLVRYI